MGRQNCSLKMLERCRITLSVWGKPLVGWQGWFLLLVPDHWPREKVKVLPPILGKNSILLLIRFLGSTQVSNFAEDKARRQSSRNKPAYLNIYLPIIK